jgi:hypothetical protein
MFCLPPPLTDTTLWQATTLSEISLENVQLSVSFEFDDQARPVKLSTTKGRSLKDLGNKIEDDLPKYIKEKKKKKVC